ncbi:MAG: sel1 repeat family protein [Burkholderiales bacterium]
MEPTASTSPKLLRTLACAALLGLPAGIALAQSAVVITPGAVAGARAVGPASSAPSAGESARYVESCQQGIEHGVVSPGCQGPIYANEIGRLKEDALRTQNPELLRLLGDAYQSPRAGLSDISQAYRWYLLAAVRGDPRAMQRLSELYRDGQGVPRDNVKALGYARLTQRLALPGSTNARGAAQTISVLGSELAAEEVALAERFADELERGIQSRGGISTPLSPPASAAAGATPAAEAQRQPDAARKPLSGLPGIGAAGGASNAAPSQPAGTTSFPGLERTPEQSRQP